MTAPDGVNVGSKIPAPEDSPAASLLNGNWKVAAVKAVAHYLIGKDVSAVLLFVLVGFALYYFPIAFRDMRDDSKADRTAQEERFDKTTAAADRREAALMELNETTREAIGQKIDRLADRLGK